MNASSAIRADSPGKLVRPESAPAVEPHFESAVSAAVARMPTPSPARAPSKSESLIAPDIAIEGKIERKGHMRVACRFKGDVDVQGNLSTEPHTTVTGSVGAKKVVSAGELIGNIDAALHVDLSHTWEYSMVLTIRDERGEEIARRRVGASAIRPDEQHTFTLSVEMTPTATSATKRTRH